VSGIYDNARLKFATAALDWRSANYLLTAWKGTKDFVPADANISMITSRGQAQQVGTSMPIVGKAVDTKGVMKTNAVVIQGIPAGNTVTFFVMALGTEPMLFVDDVLGLPYLSNGLDIVVQPDWALAQGWCRV